MNSSLKAIETCIYWQRYVIEHSRDPVQITRAKTALARLQAELNQLKG